MSEGIWYTLVVIFWAIIGAWALTAVIVGSVEMLQDIF